MKYPKKIIFIDSIMTTIFNLLILVVLVTTFILVFFYPDRAGEIGATIVKSFQNHIK